MRQVTGKCMSCGIYHQRSRILPSKFHVIGHISAEPSLTLQSRLTTVPTSCQGKGHMLQVDVRVQSVY